MGLKDFTHFRCHKLDQLIIISFCFRCTSTMIKYVECYARSFIYLSTVNHLFFAVTKFWRFGV